jgi:putative transposase
MTSDSSIAPLRQPEEIGDPLTAVLKSGARRLLARAIEAEADAFPATMKGAQLPDGRDRGVDANGGRICFTSAILLRSTRRTLSLDTLLPILSLRGVSMGDVQEALAALLDRDAPNLSPLVIARRRGEREGGYARWQRGDLSARQYVYM